MQFKVVWLLRCVDVAKGDEQRGTMCQTGPARLVLGTSILRECPCHRSCMTVLCLYIVLFCAIFLWSYYVIKL